MCVSLLVGSGCCLLTKSLWLTPSYYIFFSSDLQSAEFMFLEDCRVSIVTLLVGFYSLMNDSFVLYLESLVYDSLTCCLKLWSHRAFDLSHLSCRFVSNPCDTLMVFVEKSIEFLDFLGSVSVHLPSSLFYVYISP